MSNNRGLVNNVAVLGCLAGSVKYATLELKVMNSHPMVDREII